MRAIFRELLSGTRRLVRQVRVCYLGPEFSYSHLAAVQQFGTSVDLIPVANISSVFDALNRGQADFGLVPIENSTDGRVADTLDMFARLPVRVCGEVQLRIHHHLLGKCRRSQIKAVYSKPQALSQCRTWLAKHLPDAQTVETASTTAAARLAVDEPGAAAIASRQAGVHYGLDFIAESIQDNPNNVTRFAVIGDEPPARTGDDKTSLMFELPHQPGALADVMGIFKRNRLNMTWIESFPMPETPSEYLFFIEFQGHAEELRARRAINALAKKTVRLEVLGSYPATAPVD
jgi:chorismate mutase/prephenate dehydratase